jgi:hypothetical protein
MTLPEHCSLAPEDAERFRSIVQPGHAVRIDHGSPNANNRTIHIRAIVDGDQVVFCHIRRSGYWFYQVESAGYFAGKYDQGVLYPEGPSDFGEEG